MGRPKRRRSYRAARPPMRSPGRPTAGRREHRRRFWQAIACGVSSEDAALAAGVSQPVGTRWFRDSGGMPPISLAPLSGRYLSFAEREEVAILQPNTLGSVTSLGESADPRRRSRGSYVAMLQPGAADLSIALRPPSGTPTERRKDRRWRSWLQTTSCAGTYKTDSQA
jgi:hypothetical protein